MPYEFDAFFSYKRNPQTDDWHSEVKKKLEFWVGQEINRKVSIFMDTEDIRTGNRWKQKLGDALKKSRCIVCIWSPYYFQSRWCVSEWSTFLERESQYGCSDLVIPARFHDGEYFPTQAKDTQSADFSSYASTMPAFWRTEKAVEFEQPHLQKFAKAIAECIHNAPEYDDDFPLIESTDDLIITNSDFGRPNDYV